MLSRIADVIEGHTDAPLEGVVPRPSSLRDVARIEAMMWEERHIEKARRHLDEMEYDDRAKQATLYYSIVYDNTSYHIISYVLYYIILYYNIFYPIT